MEIIRPGGAVRRLEHPFLGRGGEAGAGRRGRFVAGPGTFLGCENGEIGKNGGSVDLFIKKRMVFVENEQIVGKLRQCS